MPFIAKEPQLRAGVLESRKTLGGKIENRHGSWGPPETLAATAGDCAGGQAGQGVRMTRMSICALLPDGSGLA